MQLFVLTSHCQSRAHCSTCRDKEGGRAWRKSTGQVYTLPEAPAGAVDPSDFECPYGLPWKEQSDMDNNQPKPTIKITQGSQKPPVKFVRTSDSRQRSPGDCGCSRKK
jgi:hypothetical protein